MPLPVIVLPNEMAERLKEAERARIQKLLIDDCARLRIRLGLGPLPAGEVCEARYRACRKACGKGRRQWPLVSLTMEPR